VPITRSVSTSSGLSGGGALSGDLTLSPTYGTSGNTICAGNDSRLSDTRIGKLLAVSHVTYSDPNSNTSENCLASILIPAGTLQLNDELIILSYFVKGGTNGTSTVRARLHTSAGTQGSAFSSGTIMASFTTTANAMIGIQPFWRIAIKNNLSVQEAPGLNFSGNGNVNAATISGALNAANDMYLVLTSQKGFASDTMALNNYSVKIER
jgi:hypothetical protein